MTKLLTLIALVLMPLGMAAAPAAAQSAPQHHGAAAAAAAHCPDPDTCDNGTADQQAAGCTMTCAALVAPNLAAGPVPPVIAPPPVRPLAERGNGLHPEAATPPPKRS